MGPEQCVDLCLDFGSLARRVTPLGSPGEKRAGVAAISLRVRLWPWPMPRQVRRLVDWLCHQVSGQLLCATHHGEACPTD